MKAFVHIQCCQNYFNKALCVVFEAAQKSYVQIQIKQTHHHFHDVEKFAFVLLQNNKTFDGSLMLNYCSIVLFSLTDSLI